MQGSSAKVKRHVAMGPGKRKALNPNRELHKLLEEVERLKASVSAKVEHLFRVIKQQFAHAKVRYRNLENNTARLTMLFALGNLWMAQEVHRGHAAIGALRGAKVASAEPKRGCKSSEMGLTSRLLGHQANPSALPGWDGVADGVCRLSLALSH